MKDLKKLEGAKMISKMEQKAIKGGQVPGRIDCTSDSDCPVWMACLLNTPDDGVCVS